MHTPRSRHAARVIGISAGAALLALAGGAVARPPHGPAGVKRMTLAGNVGGTWNQTGQTQDGAYQLSGNGDIAPLGPVQIAGRLGTTAVNGRATGTVTLTGPRGTLTLALSGATTQPRPTAPSSALTYTITGGTGAYQGQQGTGIAHLTMTPQRRPEAVPGRIVPHFIVAAMFSLTLGA